VQVAVLLSGCQALMTARHALMAAQACIDGGIGAEPATRASIHESESLPSASSNGCCC
jgi:hypothetical protein